MTKIRTLLIALFVCLSLWPGYAAAQFDFGVGPVTQQSSADEIKDFSNKMYARCHANPDVTLSPEQQEEYCSCLSAKIYSTELTHDERQYIATGTGPVIKDQLAYAKVYSHCMGPSVYNKFYHDCTHDHDLYKVVKSEDNAKEFCDCVADDMAVFSNMYGPSVFKIRARRDINLEDPLEFLVNSRGFAPQYSESHWLCRKKFGRRD